ncbi:RsmB/NOP family class I SAM-dependent RNA methyltransferase [Roseomonas sp. SSH11]|uniref:RsmB/NOP family class I SAM-dependent RNA methyltransferase n=1 Tax=Pararoseomonas baculiformis TaxID=2820812 RepID=A0ABS4AGB3_9PROT|nr:RsmB/NOP family class I SAM-dependent RNA methyltransferase [Pararoseomonas baculiformis]MBP0446067.1 RsmB/NOP family class I SAM-dependent RNA methyltransferase [Pararoseomonas baculiformis]
MTPLARLAAAVSLLAELEAAPRRPADAVANDFFRARRYIGGGDRRAIAERAWAVVRERLRLDWHLARAGAAPTARLLIAAHMLLAEGGRLAGLDAAFTGEGYAEPRLSPDERRVLARLEGQPLVHPDMDEATRLNLPGWVMEDLRNRFGGSLPEAAAAMETSAPLDLRVNLLRSTREEAARALAAEGIPTEPTPYSPWGLRVADRRPILNTRAFEEGWVEIQDEGSQLIAALADARPGMKVADYCAGAAGKTLAMAATMRNRGRIAALDVSAPRLTGAAKRLRRAGVDNAETHLLEAGDRWVKRRAAQFDRVLVDAPCTGTGTWRRNPDARLRTTPEDYSELITKQRAILDRASTLVRPGGKLIYATCSVLPGEDEEQVREFLDTHADFETVPLAEAWAEAGMKGPAPGEGAHMALAPHSHGTDGFFAAVLRRRS